MAEPGPRLSVAIVCRNNEGTIARTLESAARLVKDSGGEIVAVDSGSTDGTIALLERAGARVIRSEWKGHIATKQMAMEACAGDWVLAVDSDESLEPELEGSIRELLASAGPGVSGARVNRKVWYRGRPLNYVWQPEWRLRLVRRGVAAWGGLDPHDVLALKDPAARAVDLNGALRHNSFETFAEHLRKQWGHARTMAESLHKAGRRGRKRDLLISPAGAFLKQLIAKRGFLDGYAGWLAAASTAAGTLMKHAMLIEMGGEQRRG
ncbi:MAG: glycosyltransferase family 2 protein [Phycisphaerales bacterium]|nr:glycosyltransferase family 2 protein [Phycisphaerales bacterium]